MSDERSDVSLLLDALSAGQDGARSRLFELVYSELHQLAARQVARERPDRTLGATALVHEAYLRLLNTGERADGTGTGTGTATGASDGTGAGFAGRAHFFGVAAEAMRRILIEAARKRSRRKRGGDRARIPLAESLVADREQSFGAVDLLDLEEALLRLAARDPRAVRVVEHRFFLGLGVAETAELLELAPRTIDEVWSFARAWLLRELSRGEDSADR